MMFYTVECSYNDPESETEWNTFYSQQKLPALISVSGFVTSQRFRAIKDGCPVYFAIHTINDNDVLSSEEYRLKGGGNFSRWQKFITEWHRNIYESKQVAPAVSLDKRLLLSSKPIKYLEQELKCHGLEMHATGLERNPEYRVAYVLPTDMTSQFIDLPDVYIYEPMTPQLQNTKLSHF